MAEREDESLKKHGDVMERAIEDADRHAQAPADVLNNKPADPIPMPENGGHERSHAAHLGKVHEQTKAADKLKEGMSANTLREPPTVVQRVGKQHR